MKEKNNMLKIKTTNIDMIWEIVLIKYLEGVGSPISSFL